MYLEHSTLVRWDEPQTVCSNKLRFEFCSGSVRDVDVPYVLKPMMSCVPFGDIRWNGYDGLARVRGQPKALLVRIIRRHPIYLDQQIHPLLPNYKLFETPKAHVLSP